MTAKERKSLAQFAAEAAAGESAGISCPRCGCRHFLRYKSIQADTRTFRYKQCRHCGNKVLTKQDHAPPEEIIREVDGHGEDSPKGITKLTIHREVV